MSVDMAWLEENIIKRTLSDSDRLALACIQERTFASGEKIIVEGQQGGTLGFMRSGRAMVEDNNRYEGRVTLVEIEPGTLFGELAFLSDRRRTADVTALEDCVVYTLTKDAFTLLMKDHHELAYSLFNAILERQTSVIMSQRITLAPFLRELNSKAKKLPLFVKLVPVIFILIYFTSLIFVSLRDLKY